MLEINESLRRDPLDQSTCSVIKIATNQIKHAAGIFTWNCSTFIVVIVGTCGIVGSARRDISPVRDTFLVL